MSITNIVKTFSIVTDGKYEKLSLFNFEIIEIKIRTTITYNKWLKINEELNYSRQFYHSIIYIYCCLLGGVIIMSFSNIINVKR